MKLRSTIAAAALFVAMPASVTSAQIASDEQELKALAAALKADDAERQSAIETCIAQGIGDDPAGAAQFMDVPVEKAASAWCRRMTNGIAEGKLTLPDLQGLSSGDISANAEAVLKTPVPGE
jgi:hypothetical protein